MKKFWNAVKSVVETLNNIYLLFAAVITVVKIWTYIADECNKNNREKNVVYGVNEDSEEELLDDFEQFVFKRREKSR